MATVRIAITPGEPAGIGPDVVLAAAQKNWPVELLAIADPTLMRARAAALGLPVTVVETSAAGPAEAHRPGQLRVVPVKLGATSQPGRLNPANAPYVLESLNTAVASCQSGTVSALVTAPVQKSVINDAGIHFTGHTEFLAAATRTSRVVMMLAAKNLRVALATTHLPLSAVPAAITGELLTETLQILHDELVNKFGIERPRIAVLGLNPHAGEGGHLGREEIDTIIPTLEDLRAKGLDLQGPLPADTAFNPRVLDECDTVYAMYHDQGLPVLKYAGFGEAINITLGLPIIRTSVDHGTALDLAGTGRANPESLFHAIETAIQLAT